MILVPLEKSIDWRRPPVVTLALIALNCAVLFLVQRDDAAFEEAIALYADSGLPEIELPLYLDALESRGELERAQRVRHAIDTPDDVGTLVVAALDLESDLEFRQQLRAGALIGPSDPRFEGWRAARDAFEQRLGESVTYGHGFVPARHLLSTLLTHMFLHGGVAHLLGNMLFLFLVGYTVELAIGSIAYLGCYLAAGVGGVLLFWAADPSSGVPLVGASGAIAGLMGMYALLFGMRRIRFFYCVVVYFDYIKAPALVMFPLWVGNEVLQLTLNEGSNVAYTAHLGGLLTGAALALAIRHLTDEIDDEYLDASAIAEDRAERLANAIRLLGQLEVERATSALRSLHADHPDDLEILTQLYRAEKLIPCSAQCHRAARSLLRALRERPDGGPELHQTFCDYLGSTRGKIRLPPAFLAGLAMRFAKAGHLATAQQIVDNLLRHRRDAEGLAGAVHSLAVGWQRAEQPEKHRHYLTVLQQHFPAAVPAERPLTGR